MSREIKFRAWDGEGGDMVPADYNDDHFVFAFSGGSPRLLELDGREWSGEDEGDYVAVNNAVFMQYTGLKDKNGVEIYEGDILEMPVSGSFQVVEFYQGEYTTGFVKKASSGQRYDLGSDSTANLKVIGNIHENPELLGEKA